MKPSRAGIVAVLIAVELGLISIAIYSLTGTMPGIASAMSFQGMHRESFAAHPIDPIDAGQTPHVVVSDPDSRVVVTASADGHVHVVDKTRVEGVSWSPDRIAQVRLSRTSDGVSIERPDSGGHGFHFDLGGLIDQRIEIAVPAGSTLDIQKSSGADVSNLNGAVTVRSQDGHITLANLNANVEASSDDGYLEATAVNAPSLSIVSNDGHLTLRDVTVNALTARTGDGRITAQGVRVEGASPSAQIHSGDGSVHLMGALAPGGKYTIGTDDGRVEVGLGSDSNLSVNAHTSDGRIVVNGNSSSDDGGTSRSFKLGSGAGTLDLSSGDGSITITTNGAV